MDRTNKNVDDPSETQELIERKSQLKEQTKKFRIERREKTNPFLGPEENSKSNTSDSSTMENQINEEELYHKQRRKQYVSPSKLEAGLAFNAGLGYLDSSNNNLSFSPNTRRRFKNLQPFSYDSKDYSAYIPLPKRRMSISEKEMETEKSLNEKRRQVLIHGIFLIGGVIFSMILVSI